MELYIWCLGSAKVVAIQCLNIILHVIIYIILATRRNRYQT